MLAELLALLLVAPAAAQDMGERVTFSNRPAVRFSAQADPNARGRALYDSGPSDPVLRRGDVLLFHGVSPDPGVTFHAGRELQGGWAGWEAEVHRFPNGRFWARATLPRGAGRVRIWAFDKGVAADHEVEILGIELTEGGEERPEPSTDPLRSPARPPQPDAPRPPVFDRAAWRAKAPTEAYTPIPLVWRLTLHHTDGKYTGTLQESLTETRFIQDFHQNGRKWIDIAYHFLIDEAGNIIEGRPEGVQGAHTLDNNEGNLGVCLLGKYHEAGHHRPIPAQLDAVARLARYVVLRHGVDPRVEFKGHRDHKPTDCPGDHAYARLAELRLRADGAPVPAAPVGGPRLRLPEMPALTEGFSWDGQRQASSNAAASASR